MTSDPAYDQRMIRVATSLTQAGYHVTLAGRQKPDSPPLPRRPFRQVRLDVKPVRGKRFYINFNRKLRQFLLDQSPDLVYAVDLDSLWACADATRRRRRIRLIFDAHEYFTQVPELQGRPFVRSFWEVIARRYIPKAQAAITVSDSLAQILSKRYGRPFHTIRNVPFLRPLPDTQGPTPKRIIYQGALNKGRGLEHAIRAMQYIHDAQLLIVGTGDIEDRLKALTARLRLENKVRFAGPVLPEKLHEITAHSWLGINLLEPTGQSYYYSLANKFFDYMMAGIPSLNPDFPEYRRILSQHPMGITIQDLSPHALADTINALLHDDTRYRNLAAAARRKRHLFHWERESQKLIAIVKKAMAAPR